VPKGPSGQKPNWLHTHAGKRLKNLAIWIGIAVVVVFATNYFTGRL